MNLPARALVRRRTIELCTGLDGGLDFGDATTMILPEVQELVPDATFPQVLSALDRAWCLEKTRRTRGEA